ncbi:MAG: serine--tRNA ligase [Clostridia bacterium]
MLDIRFIKENTAKVKERLNARGKNLDAEIDEILSLDAQRREILVEVEQLKAEQNKVTKTIPTLKKEGKSTTEVFAKMKEMSDTIKSLDDKLAEVEPKLTKVMLSLPNIPNDKVPVGKDENDNVELRKVGTPKKFDFELKPHWEIGEELNILDPQTAGKVTGSRFHFYKGLGARLERAVINYYLDTHGANGYTEIFPPFLANRASFTCTGQLPKFEEDMFKIEGMEYFLIPTAEVPVTNMYRDDILEKTDLPIKHCAYSACFRAEGGSAGRDTRGLIRQHQFNKVELVKFADPANSYDELESLTLDAERVLQGLGIPYRVVQLCTGDMGFSSACTYDIEVYMPSYERYVEISSCSNFEDFQARRGMIRTRDEKGKPVIAHTLNGSGVAIGRTVACILETYQNEDGSVNIPDALVPYMGVDIIKK